MSQLTPEIPFMASLWIRSGCDMKVEVSVETYQEGAHFKALINAILDQRFCMDPLHLNGMCPYFPSFMLENPLFLLGKYLFSTQSFTSHIYSVSSDAKHRQGTP